LLLTYITTILKLQNNCLNFVPYKKNPTMVTSYNTTRVCSRPGR